jgi:hypothetical protein
LICILEPGYTDWGCSCLSSVSIGRCNDSALNRLWLFHQLVVHVCLCIWLCIPKQLRKFCWIRYSIMSPITTFQVIINKCQCYTSVICYQCTVEINSFYLKTCSYYVYVIKCINLLFIIQVLILTYLQFYIYLIISLRNLNRIFPPCVMPKIFSRIAVLTKSRYSIQMWSK